MEPLTVAGYIAAVLILIRIYLKLIDKFADYTVSMQGKVVLITGGTSGIGYETAKDLARRGAKVIVAAFDSEEVGNKIINQIRQDTNNKNVFFKYVNLANFKSIRDLGDSIATTEDKLDVLINNAGTGMNQKLTEDGFNTTVQVNYFAPCLLMYLMLPLLKKAEQGRIVNVSSLLYLLGQINFDSPKKNQFFHNLQTYNNSKLCLLTFSRELAKKLQGTNVTVNTVHPFIVNTPIFSVVDSGFLRRFFVFMCQVYGKTPWEGAQPTIHCAVEPSLKNVTGKFFGNCSESWTLPIVNDSVVSSKLFDKTALLLNIPDFEMRCKA